MFYFCSIDKCFPTSASFPLSFLSASNFNFQYPLVRLYLCNEGIRPRILRDGERNRFVTKLRGSDVTWRETPANDDNEQILTVQVSN